MDNRLHRVVMPGGAGGAPVTVQRFNDTQTQAAVEAALANLKANSAILDVRINNEDGVRGVVAAKLGGRWSVGLIGELDRQKDWAAGVRVGFSW
jgi:hypothetical protein